MKFDTLTRSRAERICKTLANIDAFGWGCDEILYDLPRKWKLSFVCGDPGIVGFAILSRKGGWLRGTPHLHRLMVAPEHRSKGYGAQMVAEAIRRAGKAMTVKVPADNHGAVRFYERHGFLVEEEGEYLFMRRSRR